MKYLIMGLAIIFGGLLFFVPNIDEEVEEYKLIEVGEYRVLHPSVHKLIEDYNEQRGINHKMPIIDGERSSDGHFRGQTFDETGRLSIFVNADDTVNSIQYVGDNPSVMPAIILLLDIDLQDKEVKDMMVSHLGSVLADEPYEYEVEYEGISIRASKGNSLCFVDIYGKPM